MNFVCSSGEKHNTYINKEEQEIKKKNRTLPSLEQSSLVQQEVHLHPSSALNETSKLYHLNRSFVCVTQTNGPDSVFREDVLILGQMSKST